MTNEVSLPRHLNLEQPYPCGGWGWMTWWWNPGDISNDFLPPGPRSMLVHISLNAKSLALLIYELYGILLTCLFVCLLLNLVHWIAVACNQRTPVLPNYWVGMWSWASSFSSLGLKCSDLYNGHVEFDWMVSLHKQEREYEWNGDQIKKAGVNILGFVLIPEEYNDKWDTDEC